jgi:hypothetical protein
MHSERPNEVPVPICLVHATRSSPMPAGSVFDVRGLISAAWMPGVPLLSSDVSMMPLALRSIAVSTRIFIRYGGVLMPGMRFST